MFCRRQPFVSFHSSLFVTTTVVSLHESVIGIIYSTWTCDVCTTVYIYRRQIISFLWYFQNIQIMLFAHEPQNSK